MKKKVLSILLCCALICSLMAVPNNPVQPPAHAEVVSMTAGGIAVVLVILAACGITFSSTAVGKKCIEQFGIDEPTVPQLVNQIVSTSPNAAKLVITAGSLVYVKQLVQKAIDYFKTKGKELNYQMYEGVKVVPYSKDLKTLFDCAPYGYNDTITMKINGVDYKYDLYYNDNFHGKILRLNGSWILPKSTSKNIDYCYATDDGNKNWKFEETRWGFYKVKTETDNCLNPFCVTKFTAYDGAVSYCDSKGVKYYEPPYFKLYQGSYDFNLIESPVNIVDAINTAILDSAEDINEAIAHSVGKAQEGIQADIQSVIDSVNQATATDTAISTDQARELLGIKEELAELEREQERIREAIKEATKEDDMNVPQLPTTITDKFPFCVPFDLIALIKTFNATPVAPKVTVPVVFQSMNYSHDFVFDFSGADWDKVAAVSRWGILLFFMLGLTLVTRKLIKG